MKMLKRLSDIPKRSVTALYGAGSAGSNFLEILRTFRRDVITVGFIDSFKTGEAEGLQIVNIKDFLEICDPTSVILITSIKWREIEPVLKENKFHNYLIIPPHFLAPSGYSRLSEDKKKNPRKNPLCSKIFSSADRKEYKEPLKKSTLLLTHPEDQKLFSVLTGSIKTHRSYIDSVSEFYYHSELKKQYFDFIRYNRIKTLIEGGVSDGGDTLEFLAHIGKEGTVYGFEPNYQTYFESPYKYLLDTYPGVKISPLGLWSYPTRISFNPSGLSSRIVTDTPVVNKDIALNSIDVTSIDEFVKKENIRKVDFIKLDVEGAEIETLEGAVNTLINHRPQLAICVYHKKEHFFQVPLFLESVLQNYEYRLGHYSACHMETVWYGIPKELD